MVIQPYKISNSIWKSFTYRLTFSIFHLHVIGAVYKTTFALYKTSPYWKNTVRQSAVCCIHYLWLFPQVYRLPLTAFYNIIVHSVSHFTELVEQMETKASLTLQVTHACILIFYLSSTCLQFSGAGHAYDRAGLSPDARRARSGVTWWESAEGGGPWHHHLLTQATGGRTDPTQPSVKRNVTWSNRVSMQGFSGLLFQPTILVWNNMGSNMSN